MTKYDDASWHYGGAYPEGLPKGSAGTHIGMFVVWCLLNDLAGEEWQEPGSALELNNLRSRRVTPGRLLMTVLDEKFVSDELSADGNAFTIAYYEGKEGDSRYVDDYLATFNTSVSDIYRVGDTWDAYEQIAPLIAERYQHWCEAGRPKFIV